MKFPVPGLLEIVVEQLLDVLERNVLRCTAFGRHVLRIVDGELEDTPQTGVAHSVAAAEFGGFGARNVVGEAG